MLRLLTQQNVAEYKGAFTRPPFSLWGDGRTLLEGLHGTFSEFRVSLKDFRVEGTAEDPSSQTVKIYLGSTGQFLFSFDRIEAVVANGTAEEIKRLPSIIENGAAWLREAVQAFTFQSHLFSYTAHCSLSEGTSEMFLGGLPTPQLPGLGTPRGSGVIFHADDAVRARRFQLTLDHSLLVENGLFLQVSVLALEDRVDYSVLMTETESLLRDSLATLGLSLDP
jgi:hypothetical protein